MQGRRIADEQHERIEALEAFARERGVSLLSGRDRGARGAAAGYLGDRRRDEARAGTRERGGRAMGAESRRPESLPRAAVAVFTPDPLFRPEVVDLPKTPSPADPRPEGPGPATVIAYQHRRDNFACSGGCLPALHPACLSARCAPLGS
jgi:hypothetical protein